MTYKLKQKSSFVRNYLLNDAAICKEGVTHSKINQLPHISNLLEFRCSLCIFVVDDPLLLHAWLLYASKRLSV